MTMGDFRRSDVRVSTGALVSAEAAREKLAMLPTKGRAPKTGYSREAFGQRWADTDGNGCDQRNDILARDLKNVVHRPGGARCVVDSGVLDPDPYTGKVVEFKRGRDTSAAVQIDHVVSLSDAWQSGAQQLGERDRERLANDPDNLLAVDGPTNTSKGDGDAATWLPPQRSAWCNYGTRQIMIKERYTLWVKPAERAALAMLLDACPMT
ncbi:HNH endonuclease family protein [Pseudonocardia sp. ICBG601]|uniref:HNH endonuclease family protein n=1 Tax=Pseudonocardia sp. ICBG601 TaxID=2846759 RepID=UPI001CF60A65|nr:HNH endonuclease family protein [Pseudonocardia sp. ICBG601]